MTTYNTKNPVPSADARDRHDNSQILDELTNGQAPSTPDRLGVLRQSWAGMEQDFNGAQADRATEFSGAQADRESIFSSFIDASGWSSLGAYSAGISIVSHSQTIDYQGQPYALKSTVPASIDSPYVITGNWATEGVNFKLVGDNSLRQDLATIGGPLVNNSTVVVASVQALIAAEKKPTQVVRTLSWYAGLNKGGMPFSWSPTTPKSRHNGGTIISPTVPYDEGAGLNDFLKGTYETAPGANGCWIADTYGLQITTLHFGSKADAVLGDGVNGADDGFSINAALRAASVQGIGRIRQVGISRHRQTILVPSYVVYEGSPSDGIQAAQNWIGTNARKSVTNADTVNGNTACGIDRLTIRGIPTGSEWDHGIHFCKTKDATIVRPNIADVAGDGICIGNITGGVNGLCVGTLIDAPVIRRVGRMGIAMTNSRGTQGRNVDIADLTGAILNAGVGIDWEPDSAGDECTDNVFIGGTIRNVKEGATMASVASLTEALSKGNAIIGVSIDTTQGDGIRATYSNTLVSGNILSNIGKNGIYVTSGLGVQGSTISDNIVISCSKSLPLTYDAYRLGGTAHCIFTGNISKATDARWSLFTESSSQNIIGENNFRASNRPWSLTSDDLKAASHNILSGAIESNTHQGFTAGGPIIMGAQYLSIAGGKIIGVTDVPAPATGADGDTAFNSGARVGTSVWYKKISGAWKAASPALV